MCLCVCLSFLTHSPRSQTKKEFENEISDMLDRYRDSMVSWREFVQECMFFLHEKGIRKEQMVERLKQIPQVEHVCESVLAAHGRGVEFHVVSDANETFIETVLEHFGLRHCFSSVVTNKSSFDEQGRLVIEPVCMNLVSRLSHYLLVCCCLFVCCSFDSFTITKRWDHTVAVDVVHQLSVFVVCLFVVAVVVH